MKIIISVNTSWNIINFRSSLIRALIIDGHEVIAVSPNDEYSEKIKSLGCQYIALPIDNKGLNPLKDILLFFRYLKIFILHRPDVYMGFTIKPNIYGSIAARLLEISVINNITGLGTVFIKLSFITQLVKLLYKLSLQRSYCVFFQNSEDRRLFVNEKIVNNNYSKKINNLQLLPGSGIDLDYYDLDNYKRLSKNNNNIKKLDTQNKNKKKINGEYFNFLFIGRIIKDKGVMEFVKAARLVKLENLRVRFTILGFIDDKNSNAFKRSEIEEWISEGLIDYLGEAEDVREAISKSDCVVLPSYREGTPRTLLEAASMKRPIIATDVVGCREVVVNEENGFLCKPFDAFDLYLKMIKMINLDPAEREKMGINGRKKMVQLFDEKIVIEKYRVAIKSLYSLL